MTNRRRERLNATPAAGDECARGCGRDDLVDPVALADDDECTQELGQILMGGVRGSRSLMGGSWVEASYQIRTRPAHSRHSAAQWMEDAGWFSRGRT